MNKELIQDGLIAMGIPVGIKGFTYIDEAINFFDERGTNISITKKLYPHIAKKYEVTASSVERAIRHAFNVARKCETNSNVVNYYIGFINCNNSSSLKQFYMMLKRKEIEISKEKEV